MDALEVKGYVDPRTGLYKSAAETDDEEILEDLGFIRAWGFYWDGPLDLDRKPVFDREAWLGSEMREDWLESLTPEQEAMLADTCPPEEILGLEQS